MYVFTRVMEELEDIYRIVKTCNDVLCLSLHRSGNHEKGFKNYL